MQYCVEHPEEVSKLAKVKAQVSEVKGVMMENIDKVLHWLLHILILTPLWLSNKIALTLHIEKRFGIYMSLAYRVRCPCMFWCFIAIQLSLEFHLMVVQQNSTDTSHWRTICYLYVIGISCYVSVYVLVLHNYQIVSRVSVNIIWQVTILLYMLCAGYW